MKRTITTTFFSLLLLFSFASSFVTGIGLRGVILKDEFFFEPGMSKDYEFILYANSPVKQDYEFYVRMFNDDDIDLAQYVTLDRTVEKMLGQYGSVPFKAHLQLPDHIDVPGPHEIRVGVRETEAVGGGAIGAKTGSEARIIVWVLYPDPWISSTFTTRNFNINQTGDFIFDITNYGKPPTDVYGIVRIINPEGQTIKTIRTKTIQVTSAQTTTLAATLDTTGLIAGEYTAQADLHWAQNITNFTQVFLIGELNASILNYTRTARTNAINRFDIDIKSGWNNPLPNVYADVIVSGSQGEKLTTFKTVSQNLAPWQQTTLQGYFDTAGLVPNTYSLTIILHYLGKDTALIGDVTISDESTTETVTEIPKLTNNPISMTVFLFVLVGLLSAITILLFIIVLKKKIPKP